MKKLLALLVLLIPLGVVAQSKTTQAFHKEHEDAFVLFFYSNTLKMLNQDNNPEFDELIKDIEKMKFLKIDKAKADFDNENYQDLIEEYKEEDFEDLMTMRHDGMNVNVYIQEDDGVTTGMVFLMSDNELISILDIKGRIPLSKMADVLTKVQSFN